MPEPPTAPAAAGKALPLTSAGGAALPLTSVGGHPTGEADRTQLRAAVRVAGDAFGAWSTTSGYRRGRALLRIAQQFEVRRDALIAALDPDPDPDLAPGPDLDPDPDLDPGPVTELDAATDRWLWYTGWADKIGHLRGGPDPGADTSIGVTQYRPVGVTGIVAPVDTPLLGLVATVAPAIVSGNTAVVVASAARPLPALAFAEVLAAARLPAGVVSVLVGDLGELARWLVELPGVTAVDLAGVTAGGSTDDSPALAHELAGRAAAGGRRVLGRSAGRDDWSAEPDVGRLIGQLTTKTIWLPREH